MVSKTYTQTVKNKPFRRILFALCGLFLLTASQVAVVSAASVNQNCFGANDSKLPKCGNHPNGTCFVRTQGVGYAIENCSKVFKVDSKTHKWIDPTNSKNLLDPRGCYSYTGGISSSNVTQVNCDGSSVKQPSTSPGPAGTQSGIDASSLPQVGTDQSTLNRLLDVFFGIIGGMAILVVTIGGMRYVFANGDPAQITQAKNTIIYALIGLVVAISGYSIVQFVIGNI